jgi:hypothetical protein
MYMDLVHAKPIKSFDESWERAFRYRILSQTPGFLRMQVVGETRRTDGGELVVWDLRMRGRDEYCWRRTDLPYQGCTTPIQRCQ